MDVTYVDIEIDKIHDVSIRQTKHVNKVDKIVKLSIINTNYIVQYVYEITVDEVIYQSKVNPQPRTFSDMNLYLSSPFVGLSFNGSLHTVIKINIINIIIMLTILV